MDSTDSAYSALDAIDTVAFKIGVRGYNVDEVDDFLERLSGEVHQLKELVQQQRQQLRQAGERINQLDARPASDAPSPAPAPAPAAAPRHISVSGAEQVTAMIAMAQQFIEQAQNEAENKAREMTTSAQERAREIVAEARSRAEDEVNRLNGLKQRLSEDVETLARQLDTERTRLSGALAEFSRWVESSLQVGGARASASVAPAPTPAPRPIKPPPAPAPVSDQGVGQVLNFEAPSLDDRL
jgi:DivIVA domain-containing protein